MKSFSVVQWTSISWTWLSPWPSWPPGSGTCRCEPYGRYPRGTVVARSIPFPSWVSLRLVPTKQELPPQIAVYWVSILLFVAGYSRYKSPSTQRWFLLGESGEQVSPQHSSLSTLLMINIMVNSKASWSVACRVVALWMLARYPLWQPLRLDSVTLTSTHGHVWLMCDHSFSILVNIMYCKP